MGKRKGHKDKKPRVGDRPWRQVGLRAFVHATEDPQKVRAALAFVAGFDLEDEEEAKRFDEQLEAVSAEGHFRNPIEILELTLKRAAQVRGFWRRMLDDPAIRQGLMQQVDDRLDEELIFWFRLDKQAAASGRLRLAEAQDVVLVRAKLATYPKDRETGLRFLQDLLRDEEPMRLL